jgi:hypothetical protein
MPDLGPFISEQHPVSRRYAVLEDDGRTGWLYLTVGRESRPVADVWVYNRFAPTEQVENDDRSRPPAIVKRFTAGDVAVDDPGRFEWRFRWSADGEAVALLRDGVIVALIGRGERRGCSAGIAAACPWGGPLSAQRVAAAGLGEAADGGG